MCKIASKSTPILGHAPDLARRSSKSEDGNAGKKNPARVGRAGAVAGTRYRDGEVKQMQAPTIPKISMSSPN